MFLTEEKLMVKILILLTLLVTLPTVCSNQKGEELRAVEFSRTSDGYLKATLGDLTVLYNQKLRLYTTWKDGRIIQDTPESKRLKRALEPIIDGSLF